MARTSVTFTGEQKETIEKAVIDIIVATKEKINFSEIVHKCVEKNFEQVKKEIIDSRLK